MCLIRIPALSKAEQGRPLQDVLDFTAARTGLSSFSMAIAMSYFFEGIAEEVSQGKTLRIPGFGVFAPSLDERPQYLARRGGPKCFPKFSASRGFRQQVMLSAPPDRAGKKALSVHRSNHRVSESRYTSSRVFTSMRAMREQISAQLRLDGD